MNQAANIGKTLHVGISVYNMDDALEWYEKNLGFQLVSDQFAPPLNARICFISDGVSEVELFEYDTPYILPKGESVPNTAIQTVGTKHLALETDDMIALKKRFEGNGVDIAHEVSMGEDKVMFIRDNSGILIEFIQRGA